MRQVILLSLVAAGCRFGFETSSATDSGANVDASEDACASYVTWGSLSSRYRQGSALDWAIAEADCESDGGHLAVVNDMAERDELSARLSSEFWIGLSDRITEGQYLEVTGAPATYLAWPGTPPSNVGEDCVEVLLNSNYEDTSCTKVVALTYACECDGVSAQPGAF